MPKYYAGILFKSKYRKGSPTVAVDPNPFETHALALMSARKEIAKAKKGNPFPNYVSWKPAVFMKKRRQ